MKSRYEADLRQKLRKTCGAAWMDLRRIKGSHHIYAKQGIGVRLSIPIHKNQMLMTGLQKHLMKMANIKEEDI